MNDLEAMKRVALDFITAMATNDAALADRCLAPGAFTISHGFSRFAGRRPREVMVGTIAAFDRLLPGGLKLAVSAVTAEGDRVVVECQGNATTCEGTAYANEYCFIMRFESGLIAQVNEFFCGVLADRVLWHLVAAEGEALAAEGEALAAD